MNDVAVIRPFDEAPWQRQLIRQRHLRPVGKVERVHYIVERIRVKTKQAKRVPARDLNRQCLLDLILNEGE
ncbi:MAG: hypothetical protein EWM73_01196 [Nitrospira sp.]|nr:MAG: hypothetical protein EWM73_01196 [Nitrospira sp.]